MQIHSLTTSRVPDLPDHVIHFTGRTGARLYPELEVAKLQPEQRLERILTEQCINGYRTFRSDAAVVCLTESTKAAVTTLVADGRYRPWGIGFSKQHAFDHGGGPAIYIRGDEWNSVAGVPHPLRSRAVRFWPGATPAPGEIPDDALTIRSEWLHEREWRVPSRLPFGWEQISFLIVGALGWLDAYVEFVESWAGSEWAAYFRTIPVIHMDDGGQILCDGTGIWS